MKLVCIDMCFVGWYLNVAMLGREEKEAELDTAGVDIE